MSQVDRRQYKSGSVFQRKDGMWIGRFEAGTDRDGKRRQVTVSATSESKCKEKLEHRKREIARDGIPDRLSAKPPTVGAWSKIWLDVIVGDLRPSTYGTTRSTIKVWIVPTIGRKRLDSLTPADIRAVFAAQRKDGRKQGTLIRTHSTLMSMLKDAVRDGHHVPQPILLTRKPKTEENDRQALSIEECLAVLGVAAQRPDASQWASVLLQGLRQGERLGLTWSCVDFEAGTLDISWQLQPLPYKDNRNKHLGFRVPDGYMHKHLVGGFHLVRPKTAKGRRIIPMTSWLSDSLATWRQVAPDSPYGLVWAGPAGMPAKSSDDRAVWELIQSDAGVTHPTGRPYLLHEARHATATLLRELDVPIDVIEAILGHSKFVTSYDHSNRLPKTRAAMDQLAERLSLVASPAEIEAS